MNGQEWFKSSYSFCNSNCVETAPTGDGMAVRDSKDAAGPVLEFGGAAWREFAARIKAQP